MFEDANDPSQSETDGLWNDTELSYEDESHPLWKYALTLTNVAIPSYLWMLSLAELPIAIGGSWCGTCAREASKTILFHTTGLFLVSAIDCVLVKKMRASILLIWIARLGRAATLGFLIAPFALSAVYKWWP